MNFKEYLKESIKVFILTKPDGSQIIYTNQSDPSYLSSLKKKFPKLIITNQSSKIPATVWADPKEYGWKIQSLKKDDLDKLDEEGEATTAGDIATVPTRLGKVQKRKLPKYGL